MKKTYLTLVALLFIVSAMNFSSAANGFELTPAGSSSAHGTAMYTTKMLGGASIMEMSFRASEIPLKDGIVYEVWLIDEQSDYKLSLGTFQPTRSERASFRAKEKMVNPAIYDKIVVTEEYLNDVNPNPSNSVVMQGNIPGAIAYVLTMNAELKGRNEVPSVNSQGKGNGIFTVNTQTNTIQYNVQYSDLEAETGAHIHGFAGESEEGSVLDELPLGNVKIDIWNYEQEDEAKILAGLTYVNVHTANYPDGEIRGQILFSL